MKVSMLITLPQSMTEDLDAVADELGTDRSDLVAILLDYAFSHIFDIFPLEEEEEGESED